MKMSPILVVTTDSNSGIQKQTEQYEAGIVNSILSLSKANWCTFNEFRLYTHVYISEVQCLNHGFIQGNEDDDSEDEYKEYDDSFGPESLSADFQHFVSVNEGPSPDELAMQEMELNARLKHLSRSCITPPRIPNRLDKIFGSNMWRIIEATMIFYKQLKRGGDMTDLKLILGQYIIAVTGKSIASLLHKAWNRLSDNFLAFFQHYRIQSDEGEGEPSSNPFSKIKEFLNSAAATFDHPLMGKLRSVLHYVLGLCLLERFGITYDSFLFSKAEEEASKKKYNSKFGFVISVIEGATAIMERLWDVFRTGSWSPLLHNGESYSRWTDSVYLIKEHSMMLHNPQANGFTFHDFISRLDTAIEQGDAILKYTIDMPKPTQLTLKKLMSELRLIKADNCTKQAARKARDAPFSMLLNGGSSVGKSSLIDIFYYTYANLHKLPIGDDYMYTRTFSDEYWSGFTSSAWMIVLDDVASKNPELQEDASMNEIIQIVNRTPTVPPQADLADKGRTPLRPEFVLATTNTKDLNAKSYYCNPLAIARRFPLVVTAYPKKEYCVLDKGTIPRRECRMLDSSRVPPQVPGIPPDLWDFVLEKVEAIPDGKTQAAKYTRLHTEPYVDIFFVLKTMAQMSKKHKQNQSLVSEANDSCKSITLCDDCCCLISRCECVKNDLPKTVCLEGCERCLSAAIMSCTCDISTPFASLCRSCSTVPICNCAKTEIFQKGRCSMCYSEDYESCGCTRDKGRIQGNYSNIFIGTAALYGLYRYKKHVVKRFMRDTGADYVKDVAGKLIHDTKEAIEAKSYDALLAADDASRLATQAKIILCDAGADCVKDIASKVMSDAKDAVVNGAQAQFDKFGCILDSVRNMAKQAKFSTLEALQYEKEKVREMMYTLGEKAREKNFISKPIIYGVLAAIPMLIAGWKAYQHFFVDELQGKETGKFDVKDEKPNPWYRDDYKVSEFELGRLTKSWKGLTQEKVVDMVSRNCMFAKFSYYKEGSDKQTTRVMRIFCIGGNLYMTNHHNLETNKFDKYEMTIIQGCGDENLSSTVYYTVYSEDVLVMEKYDLAFFRLRSMPPRSSMVELFPDHTFRTSCKGFLINRSEHGAIDLNVCRAIDVSFDVIDSTTDKFGSYIWQAKVTRNTIGGECGSVLLGFAPSGPFIGGIHVRGGVSNNAFSMRVNKSIIEEAIEHFKEPMIQGCAPNLVDEYGNTIPLGPLHPKSPFRFLEKGNATVYGSTRIFRGGRKSKVGDTIISEAMQKRGCKVYTGAPDMTSWRPWYHAAKDTTEQTFNVKENVLKKCRKAYVNDILAELKPNDLAELIVLNDVVTVNGQPGVQYIDKMKRNTSMGFPWNKKKSNYLSAPYQYEEWQDCVEFPESFYKRTRTIEESYREGYRCMPIYTAHLKDEARKLSKVLSGQTREFCGAPADFAFVVRKYLLSSVRMIQKNRHLFEAAPGLNTTSTAWHDLHEHLTRFGRKRMIAGDFRAFDKKMQAIFILEAFEILIEILTAAGWEENDLQIIKGISFDVAFPLVDFNGDLVEFWGSNPSGHPLTVIINCLVNSLYMRYVWHEIGYDLSEFKKFVALITYGDDNAMGVSEQRSKFNHTAIQNELAKIGVTYTMADKEAESVPYIDMDQVTFLKRSWRFEPEVGSFVAPLDEESIWKSLTKNIPSSEVCPERQGVDLLHGALREYWYYGRETFNAKRKEFLEVIDEVDLLPFYQQEFPCYDDIRNEYINNSKNVDFDMEEIEIVA